MLTILDCRRLLGAYSHGLSDSQIEDIREGFMEIAHLAVHAFKRDQQIEIEERAAVLEFDANLPREQAMRTARGQVRRHRQKN